MSGNVSRPLRIEYPSARTRTGGHCIPVDPFDLSWKAKINGFEQRFIELAEQVNSCMILAAPAMVTSSVEAKACVTSLLPSTGPL